MHWTLQTWLCSRGKPCRPLTTKPQSRFHFLCMKHESFGLHWTNTNRANRPWHVRGAMNRQHLPMICEHGQISCQAYFCKVRLHCVPTCNCSLSQTIRLRLHKWPLSTVILDRWWCSAPFAQRYLLSMSKWSVAKHADKYWEIDGECSATQAT